MPRRGPRAQAWVGPLLAPMTPTRRIRPPNDLEPRRRPFAFASAEQAIRFVDDALDSLEYLNCFLVEP